MKNINHMIISIGSRYSFYCSVVLLYNSISTEVLADVPLPQKHLKHLWTKCRTFIHEHFIYWPSFQRYILQVPSNFYCSLCFDLPPYCNVPQPTINHGEVLTQLIMCNIYCQSPPVVIHLKISHLHLMHSQDRVDWLTPDATPNYLLDILPGYVGIYLLGQIQRPIHCYVMHLMTFLQLLAF